MYVCLGMYIHVYIYKYIYILYGFERSFPSRVRRAQYRRPEGVKKKKTLFYIISPDVVVVVVIDRL